MMGNAGNALSFAALCGPTAKCFKRIFSRRHGIASQLRLKRAKPVVGATGFEVGVFFLLLLNVMEKKPNSGADYVVITVRLPVKLLARLSRWLLVAGSMYLLLRH